jgi:phosphatidylinositol kinase/protein kinase (PI-3  family)
MLIIRGFLEIRKSAYQICSLVDTIMFKSTVSCFIGGASTLTALEKRFHLDKSGETCVELAISFVEESANNWRTVQYDSFQRLTNGIL